MGSHGTSVREDCVTFFNLQRTQLTFCLGFQEIVNYVIRNRMQTTNHGEAV